MACHRPLNKGEVQGQPNLPWVIPVQQEDWNTRVRASKLRCAKRARNYGVRRGADRQRSQSLQNTPTVYRIMSSDNAGRSPPIRKGDVRAMWHRHIEKVVHARSSATVLGVPGVRWEGNICMVRRGINQGQIIRWNGLKIQQRDNRQLRPRREGEDWTQKMTRAMIQWPERRWS